MYINHVYVSSYKLLYKLCYRIIENGHTNNQRMTKN